MLESLPLFSLALLNGLRHGFDIDHLVAISDLSGSQNSIKKSIFVSLLYVLGHGAVVFILGIIAIFFRQYVPGYVDDVFGSIVGITLIVLGVYLLFSVIRFGKEFRMKSRVGVFLETGKSFYHRFLHAVNRRHEHPKIREEQFAPLGSFGIGMIHGVGAETPTQVLMITSLLGIKTEGEGVLFLLLFIFGILISNTLVSVFASFGFLKIKKYPAVHMALGIATGVFSLLVGFSFL